MNNLGQKELYAKSNSVIAEELGSRLKGYRKGLRMTRKELSALSGVSEQTIVRFENGTSCSISINNYLALLRALQRLEFMIEVIPDMPGSLYSEADIRRINKRKP